MNKVKLQAKLHEAIEEQFEGNTNKVCSYMDSFTSSIVIMRDGTRYTFTLKEDKLTDKELVELLAYELEQLELRPEMREEAIDRRNELMKLTTKLHYKSLSTSNNN